MFKPGDRVYITKWSSTWETSPFKNKNKIYSGTVVQTTSISQVWIGVVWDERYHDMMYRPEHQNRYWEINIHAIEHFIEENSSLSLKERQLINKIKSLYRKSTLPFVQEWAK